MLFIRQVITVVGPAVLGNFEFGELFRSDQFECLFLYSIL